MSFNINHYRRNIMRGISSGIGKKDKVNKERITKVKRVLIIRPNHRLGNQLLITPLIQEIIATYPDCTIDLFTKGGLAPFLFGKYSNIRNYFLLPKKHFKQLHKYIATWIKMACHRYDLIINAGPSSSSGSFALKLVSAPNKLNLKEAISATSHEDYIHMAKQGIYHLREALKGTSLDRSGKPFPTLNIQLTEEELVEGKHVLDSLVSPEKPTIMLYTYATGSKCFSTDWWIPYYENLQQRYPDYNILEILPAENVSMIEFKAPSYLSMNLRTLTAVMAHGAILIGTDSGMMHMGVCSQIPIVGLFNVTNPIIYGPYGNGSLSINIHDEHAAEELDEAVSRILQKK